MAPKSSTRPLDMPLATWITNTHADIAERTAAAQAALASKASAPTSTPSAPSAPSAPSVSKKATKAKASKKDVAAVAETAEVAEPKAKKPPTDWIVFCARVRTLLKESEKPIKGISDSSKFFSMLKTKKAYSEWTNEAILEERSSWVSPSASASVSDTETVKVIEEPKVAEVKEKKPVKARAKKA